jgi:hypothetical protein
MSLAVKKLGDNFSWMGDRESISCYSLPLAFSALAFSFCSHLSPLDNHVTWERLNLLFVVVEIEPRAYH